MCYQIIEWVKTTNSNEKPVYLRKYFIDMLSNRYYKHDFNWPGGVKNLWKTLWVIGKLWGKCLLSLILHVVYLKQYKIVLFWCLFLLKSALSWSYICVGTLFVIFCIEKETLLYTKLMNEQHLRVYKWF